MGGAKYGEPKSEAEKKEGIEVKKGDILDVAANGEIKGVKVETIEHSAELTQEQSDQINNWFSYHNPTPDQLPKYQRIRESAKAFAAVVISSTPKCADQSAAIRKIREAVWVANASIACEGK